MGVLAWLLLLAVVAAVAVAIHWIASHISNDRLWSRFLADDSTGPDLSEEVRALMIPDRISFATFAINLTFLEAHGQSGIFVMRHGVQPNPSPSARAFESVLDRPPMTPLWFLAAYPDVVVWMNEAFARAIRHGEPIPKALEEALGSDPEEEETGNTDARATVQELRALVDSYIKTSHRSLECRLQLQQPFASSDIAEHRPQPVRRRLLNLGVVLGRGRDAAVPQVSL